MFNDVIGIIHMLDMEIQNKTILLKGRVNKSTENFYLDPNHIN